MCTDADSDIEGTILVEASRGEPVGGLGDKASLTTADARPPFGSADRPTRLSLVRLGTWCPAKPVSAWVDGPVAESYPVQATAAALAVVGCGP